MTANVQPLTFPRNVAPQHDAEVLVNAIHEAVDRLGHDEFARSLVELPLSEERLAA